MGSAMTGAGGAGEGRVPHNLPGIGRPSGAAGGADNVSPAPRSLAALDPDALAAFFDRLGEPRYRARQVMDWVYAKAAGAYSEMSNLPLALRERLAREAPLYSLKPSRRIGGRAGEAEKFLFETDDGDSIEAVLIRQPGRNTVCLSSQAGCPIGCAFCATGLSGFSRNLRAEEIVEQVVHIKGLTGERVHNVVYMGMGEPLLNYEAVTASVRRINAPVPLGLGIGARHITISTVGIVPAIERLAAEDLQVELAISLHAPDDETREALVPAARRYKVREVVDAARRYFKTTGRQVTFEYVLLKGVNDSPRQASNLVPLLSGFDAKVNLIPYNPVEGTAFERPGMETVEKFRSILSAAGIPVTVRLSKGGSIRAACGQLRRASAAERTAASGEGAVIACEAVSVSRGGAVGTGRAAAVVRAYGGSAQPPGRPGVLDRGDVGLIPKAGEESVRRTRPWRADGWRAVRDGSSGDGSGGAPSRGRRGPRGGRREGCGGRPDAR